MTTMMQWRMDEHGADALRLDAVALPEPGPGEVLVRVGAVSLNYRDKMVIANGMGMRLAFPFTPGSDLAGTVVATGPGTGLWRSGDRVISAFFPDWRDGPIPGTAATPGTRALGGTYPGVLAQYVALPEAWFVRAPATLDDVAASTLPCAGLTAWSALADQDRLRPGETVLVHGTGGVSLFAAAIAKRAGAIVIAVSGSAEKLDRLRALGLADHGIDRSGEDWGAAVLRVTGGRGVDHIVETVGGSNLAGSLRVAAPGGRVSLIGVLDGFGVSATAGDLLMKNTVVRGIAVGHRRALEEFVSAVDQTALTPVIDATYPMAALRDALAHLDRGPFGKIVVTIGADG
ncbi:NAD(P)-dependent alcohol dehydrogenase [Methyloraptor flagellatus]|uniref:NAD(P)-dependent alcohol dehydrogenase n=2 Tax=Methyloraptor flagellatus TaxID=3162530 RepID=A0AAU7X9D9_9HYPH